MDVDLSPHPHRAPYAELGGPAATLDWATRALDRPVRGVTQQRTWNLSAIWRLDTDTGPVWVKHVPHFLAHEAAVLAWTGPPLVPEVLAVPGSDPGTALELLRPVAALRNAAVYARFLAHIEPSEHRYHAADVGGWLDRALR